MSIEKNNKLKTLSIIVEKLCVLYHIPDAVPLILEIFLPK